MSKENRQLKDRQYLSKFKLLFAVLTQREVERIGAKVDAATLLEKFITNMQRERSEVSGNITQNKR